MVLYRHIIYYVMKLWQPRGYVEAINNLSNPTNTFMISKIRFKNTFKN